MSDKHQRFEYANGRVKPVLSGDNFFGWHQAILDAAYAGGYVDILLGTFTRPVDPSQKPHVQVKQEIAIGLVPGVQETDREDGREGEEGDGAQGTSHGTEEGDIVEVDRFGKEVSADQRRREVLDWDKKDREALSLLLRSVDQQFHWQVVREKHAADAWKLICDAHHFKQESSVNKLRAEITAFFLLDNGDMQEHLRKFGSLVERGTKSGLSEFQTDAGICNLFLQSLPHSLKDIRRDFERQPKDKQTFGTLHGIYYEEMQGRKTDRARAQLATQPGAIMYAGRGQLHGRGGGGRDRGRGRGQQNVGPPRHQDYSPRKQKQGTGGKVPPGVCWNCNKPGHWRIDCEEPPKEKGATAAVAVRKDERGFTLVAEAVKKTGYQLLTKKEDNMVSWVLDSGATHHITYDKSLLSDIKTLEEPLQFEGFNDDMESSARSAGTFNTYTPDNTPFKISNVHYLPKGRLNLLSGSTIMENGWDISLRTDGGEIKGYGHVLRLRREKGFWMLDLPKQKGKILTAAAGSTPSKTLQEWHVSLGHLGVSTIKKLEKASLVTITDKDSTFTGDQCDTCMISKATRLSFTDIPVRAQRQLELLHTDVAGPLKPSIKGHTYYLTVIDDFSKLLVSVAMTSKSAWNDTIKIVNLLETQFEGKVRIIRSDGGKEYSGYTWDKFLYDKGIIHQTTTAHTPQLNGVAERMNRTIKEMTAAMIRESTLDMRFWDWAVAHATMIINRCRVDNNGVTVFEKFFRRRPHFDDVQPFGTTCWVVIPSAVRRKADLTLPKAWKGQLLGLPYGSAGYVVWNPEKEEAVNTRDVIFPQQGAKPDEMPEIPSDNEDEEDVGEMMETPVTSTVDEQAVPVSTPITTNTPIRETPPTMAQPKEHILPEPTTPVPSSPPHVQESPPHMPEHEEEHTTPPLMEEVTETVQGAVEEIEEDVMAPVPEAIEPRKSARLQARQQQIPRIMILDGVQIRSNGGDHGWALTVEESLLDDDPKTYAQAMSSPLAKEWQKAMDKELENVQKAGTWVDATAPDGRTVVGSKWVYKTKRDQHGKIIKYKARIVAKGYSQVPGQDFDETYSPVARLTSLRIFVALAAYYDLELGQMDVVSAFLNGLLDKPIYMQCPKGYTLAAGMDCVKLLKALYGLKQAGRTWWEALDEYLKEMGFERISQDWGVYRYKGKKTVFLIVYVDDLLIAAQDKETVRRTKEVLARRWEMTDAGEPQFMLGLKITRNRQRHQIMLSQSAYIDTLLLRFGQSKARTVITPLETSKKLSTKGEPCQEGIQRYQQLVGGLMWASITTRPDLAFAVSALGRQCAKPTQQAWDAGIHVLKYLNGTRTHGLVLGGKGGRPPVLEAWSDADWAGDDGGRDGWMYEREQETAATSRGDVAV